MPRSTNNVSSRRRRKKILKLAKGYYSGRHRMYRHAKSTVERALNFAFRDRKARKREFRSLWIARINAAARINGLSYSRLMDGLRKAKVEVDRKVLADMAVNDMNSFARLVEVAKKSLTTA